MAEQGYWDRFTKQRATRRRVVSGLAGLGVSAVALGLVGCGDDDDGGSTGTTGSGTGASTGAASQGEPVVDRVVLSLNYSGLESNDPRDIGGGASWQLAPMYESMNSHDLQTGLITPGLATEWEASADGMMLRFKLRDGVKFHDGSDLTPEDVKFSYEYAVMNPEKGVRMRQRVARVELTSDNDFVAHFTEPDIINFTMFTDMYTWGSVVSQADFEKNGEGNGLTKPPLAGTGSWKYLSREPGSNIRFAQFADHWRKVPDFKELEFLIQKENSTRQAALLADETHVTMLPLDLQESAAGSGMMVVPATVRANHFWLQFYGRGINVRTNEYHHPNSPLHDIRVRKAMNKAINRDEIMQAFLTPDSEKMSFACQFSPNDPGWDESWDPSGARWQEEYGFDLAAAKALLEAAGYNSSNPFKTTMFASTRPIAEALDIQQTVIGMWRAVGIEAEFTTMDGAAMDSSARAFEFDNHIKFDSTTAPPPSVLAFRLNSMRLGAADPNYKGAHEDSGVKGVAETFDKAISTFGEEEHAALMREVGEELFANHAMIPLFYVPTHLVVNPKVVAGWQMPGVAGGTISHTAYIEAVRK